MESASITRTSGPAPADQKKATPVKKSGKAKRKR
jgi:hypothetical protein